VTDIDTLNTPDSGGERIFIGEGGYKPEGLGTDVNQWGSRGEAPVWVWGTTFPRS